MTSTGAGSAMQLDLSQVRLTNAGAKYRGKLDSEHIQEIRKLLRTDKTVAEIAAHFHVTRQTLRSFIKRRNICNLGSRRNFITLQNSLTDE